jgi:hypothetical protein
MRYHATICANFHHHPAYSYSANQHSISCSNNGAINHQAWTTNNNQACATDDKFSNGDHLIILPSMSIWGHWYVFFRQLPRLLELSLRCRQWNKHLSCWNTLQ